ncbi:hypothetical protein Pmar_PMAR017693 [Perkinsus marinus ATCC 50983]|uniref:Uncharacterized protein n=1 Tax=Perkinsus marinus (strain ATCC 50983 / TXsc) TaxID=423536 RepID=C5L3Q9_PERM5|nr:hypothetical protein Pmar_PMAR017693 [Perkinsus marinus ATCC 50983]EER08638.1 hypothetical protein Pmar_PMAR017693 [Perkinsus marinus ATCC 50983]|eukprot:XP_002776822.1 hypothetical protein Pmar_PMAR017693 [Perkinsus marinus ATCC 50983]
MGYPTYTAPPNNYDGREKDGIDEIERAAEQRMQEAATMIVPLHRPQYRFPSNSPMLKMFRVYLEKQLNDTKLGAVLTEVSLPAAAEDEYGAGLRVKTVLEAAEIGETGLLARWNEKARPLDRDVRVGDVIVSVLDGSAVESLGPEASSRKLMDKLKKSVKFNSLIILDVLREAPPLEVCDWPQTQQTIIACLERMEKNFIERKDQAMTWFVGDVAPIILSPSSHLWCPLCECKQQTLTAYLAHFDSPEHLEKRRVTSSKFDSRWAKLPIGISKYYWFEYCYGFTSIVDPSEGDPYCEFCDYSPIGS